MRLEEAHGQVERLREPAADQFDGGRRDDARLEALDVADQVIADRVVVLREVLLADEGAMVSEAAQGVEPGAACSRSA